MGGIDMEKLQKIVDVRGPGIPGLQAELVLREGNVCIYSRNDDHFEVFLVQVSPATNAFGKALPEREVYPGNEDFGKTAWSFREKKNALKHARVLIKSPRFRPDIPKTGQTTLNDNSSFFKQDSKNTEDTKLKTKDLK